MARAVNKKDKWYVDFYYPDRKHRRTMLCKARGRKSAEEVAKDTAERITEMLEAIRTGGMVPPENIEDAAWWLFTGGKSRTRKPVTIENEKTTTISKLSEQYLDYRKLRTENKIKGKKGLSLGSYASDFYRLENIKKYCRNHNAESLDKVATPDFLKDYQTYVLENLGAVDAKHHLRTFKALLAWGWENSIIKHELPRNLLSRNWAMVDLGNPKTDSLTVEQVHLLLKKSNGILRVAILLGLNCGYYSSDIAMLKHDMIDWTTGLITRNREKTGIASQHKLWPITLKLLKEQATNSVTNQYVLAREDGQPLLLEEVKKDGKPSIYDVIINQFNKLRKKTGVTLSFKSLRKTATQALEKQYQTTPWVVELFLAHVETRTRKFYTGQSFDILHPATDWLLEYLRLNDGGIFDNSGESTTQEHDARRSTSS